MVRVEVTYSYIGLPLFSVLLLTAICFCHLQIILKMNPSTDLELAQFWLAFLVFYDAVSLTLALWAFEPLMTD